MQPPILHSAGTPREIASLRVIAFYHPDTGAIAHTHTVITFRGAQATPEKEAIEQARRLAEHAGIPTAHLRIAISHHAEHARGPHRIDPTTQAFIALPLPHRPSPKTLT